MPAALEVNHANGTADLVAEPELVPEGVPPDAKPDEDDISRIFAAWGLSQDEWEIDGNLIWANSWPMVIAAGDIKVFRQWKAKLRKRHTRSDVNQVLEGVRRMRPRKNRAPAAAGRVRNFVVADPQMGKAAVGGSERIVNRWMDSVQQTLDSEMRARRMGYGTDRLIIPLMGDLIENCTSGHQSQHYEIDLHLTDQVKVVHECIWQTIKAMAPEWESVQVAAAPGNHGEAARIGKGAQNSTMPSDNWDVAIPDMVRRSIAEMAPDGVFDHVEWFMPHSEELTVVMPISDSLTLGMAHGHQFAGGKGDPLVKALNWWKEHLVNDAETELAHVDVMLVGHFHHFRIQRSGTRTLILCPSLENEEGSRWFQNKTGANCPPGALTFILDADHPWPVRQLEVN